MQHRYQGHQTQTEDRPRDEHGRFESEHEGRSGYRNRTESRDYDYRNEDEIERRYQSQDRSRDAYGRFESSGSGRSSGPSREDSSRQYGRPRDEYGRFESSNSGPYSGSSQSDWYSQHDRPRDEYGRFESGGQYSGLTHRGSSSQFDRPRDEHGRFESEGGHRDYYNGQSLRGQHAGKGPKGYQRSDERIQEDVSESLAQDSDLDASEIEVKVHNGVVTLTGMVSDRQFKRMAEDLAERCSGVKDVRNEIRTGRESDTTEKGKSTSSATARNH